MSVISLLIISLIYYSHAARKYITITAVTQSLLYTRCLQCIHTTNFMIQTPKMQKLNTQVITIITYGVRTLFM